LSANTKGKKQDMKYNGKVYKGMTCGTSFIWKLFEKGQHGPKTWIFKILISKFSFLWNVS
jgi:hypothetical protein